MTPTKNIQTKRSMNAFWTAVFFNHLYSRLITLKEITLLQPAFYDLVKALYNNHAQSDISFAANQIFTKAFNIVEESYYQA